MTRFGFHASHEQIEPGGLLRATQAAEQAGFTAAMCSDHFAPWTSAQGQSGFAWSWLGAALATTDVAQYVRPDDMHPQVLASSDPEQHVAWLAELAGIGFDEVYVHHVGQEQQGFLDVYAEKVLPALGAT